MQPSERFRINEPNVIQETIEGEAVIVSLTTGNYYSLDKVGAHIWGNIEGRKTVGEIVESIFSQYSGDPKKISISVEQLINELIKEELVVADSSNTGEAMTPSNTKQSEVQGNRVEFEVPVLKKYSDMQDLLLLDPIHEVDEAGWPNIKTTQTNQDS